MYSFERSKDDIFKIIRNSDNNIIHTYKQTGAAKPLNEFVTINKQTWWFGGYDCMNKVLVNCDTNDVYTDPIDESDSDTDDDSSEVDIDLYYSKYTERNFIWTGPYLVSGDGKYLLMHGCVWGCPYAYELFDISDLPNGYKYVDFRKCVVYKNSTTFSTYVGQHKNMEYIFNGNVLEMYYVDKSKILVYKICIT